MAAEDHRAWRERIGALILGGLDESEAALVRAHLEGCEECRREAEALRPLGELLLRADPAHLDPAPQPPARLANRVFARIREERQAQRRRRFRVALAGATAAVVLGGGALVGGALLGSSGDPEPSEPQPVWVRAERGGVEMSAAMVAQNWGTEIHVYVRGVAPGTQCRVFVRDEDGVRVAAGSFRYLRDSGGSTPSLSTSVATDQIRALEIEAGARTYVAPLRSGAASS
jgi:anti-sigma factor RsiW